MHGSVSTLIHWKSTPANFSLPLLFKYSHKFNTGIQTAVLNNCSAKSLQQTDFNVSSKEIENKSHKARLQNPQKDRCLTQLK